MEEAWRRLGGGLEDNWRTIGGLSEAWRTIFPLGRSNWLQIMKNKFLRFLHFYPLISSFQALSCDQDDTAHFSLSSGIKNPQFDFIWLGIDPFFNRFSIDVRQIFDRFSIDLR